jgi:peptidyl-tRNA hydrolase
MTEQVNKKGNHKLYIITGNDLSLFYQLPQVAHGVSVFASEHETEYKDWLRDNHHIIVFAVENLVELLEFHKKVKTMEVKHTIFEEPDINNEITVVVLCPCRKAKRAVEGLKLAGK